MTGAERHGGIQAQLQSLAGKYGILGCLLVSPDGAVIASSLPENMDQETMAAISATLFSNNDVSIQRMNRGNLMQMTLLTDQGVLHFLQSGSNILIVLTAPGQRVNLEGLIRSVEEAGSQIGALSG